ncbi:MAG: nicotinate-nucleotide--dimethylbenzimidazole phosphoribosyltransferase [Oscillospiraceae bacterium]
MKRIGKIVSADKAAAEMAQEHWNSVGKPLHSLGLLEGAVIKIAGITGSESVDISKRCAVVFCADNGVVAEGVTQSDSSVTAIVAKAIASGTSSINRMAQTFHADVFPVDIGMDTDIYDERILRRKISCGTGNIAVGAAMSRENAERAITAGMDIAGEMKDKGYDILVTGEMGIGNTTTSAAIASVLLDESPEAVTGKGAGLSEDGLFRKISAVKRAIAVNSPDAGDPVDILAKLGGYDIAGMTGLFLGGAYYRIPVVIDGVISAVAAVLAAKLCPAVCDYMLCSHVSKEPAGRKLLDSIGMKPIITGELCLGEGTGGILLLPLLDGALAVYASAHRFDELDMERYVEL